LAGLHRIGDAALSAGHDTVTDVDVTRDTDLTARTT